MTTATEEAVFLRGKNRNFTSGEWEELSEQMGQAFRRGDLDEVCRIGDMIPVHPNIAKAFKEVYGKQRLLDAEVDLTEANHKWGEGWLDEPNSAE
ncbi:MAG: hypothetical protein LBV12_04730 [Puniceicoccales bacterium]|nr:hypothetical protein [Puniceicoccales bacterium]